MCWRCPAFAASVSISDWVSHCESDLLPVLTLSWLWQCKMHCFSLDCMSWPDSMSVCLLASVVSLHIFWTCLLARRGGQSLVWSDVPREEKRCCSSNEKHICTFAVYELAIAAPPGRGGSCFSLQTSPLLSLRVGGITSLLTALCHSCSRRCLRYIQPEGGGDFLLLATAACRVCSDGKCNCPETAGNGIKAKGGFRSNSTLTVDPETFIIQKTDTEAKLKT